MSNCFVSFVQDYHLCFFSDRFIRMETISNHYTVTFRKRYSHLNMVAIKGISIIRNGGSKSYVIITISYDWKPTIVTHNLQW